MSLKLLFKKKYLFIDYFIKQYSIKSINNYNIISKRNIKNGTDTVSKFI